MDFIIQVRINKIKLKELMKFNFLRKILLCHPLEYLGPWVHAWVYLFNLLSYQYKVIGWPRTSVIPDYEVV